MPSSVIGLLGEQKELDIPFMQSIKQKDKSQFIGLSNYQYKAEVMFLRFRGC
jgi:hypothetical protein